jgi:MFS family permease
MVAMSASQPLAGKGYTLWPKKLVYLLYLLAFEIRSLVCGLAPSSSALIAGRAVAGFGASGVFAGGFTILTTINPLHKRAVWTGLMGATVSIASIVGPVIARALTQNVTWRWCFYINVGLVHGCDVVGLKTLIKYNLDLFSEVAHWWRRCHHVLSPRPSSSGRNRKEDHHQGQARVLDILGFVLFASSITMLLLALQWDGIERLWSSSVIIGLLVSFGVVMLLFVLWTLRQKENALVPPWLFTVNKNPALLCAAAFFVNGPFQVIIYWFLV